MTLNGPSNDSVKSCQWQWMGPVLLTGETADGLTLAQYSSKQKELMALNEPSMAFEKCDDSLE